MHEGKSIRCSLQLSSKCPLPHIGVNATGTLGVAGRAPKTRESRRRRRQGGGVSGAVPLPRKFLNFSSQNGVIWCILGVLFLRFMCRMKKNKTLVEIFGGRQHRTTPAGQILGVATPATPAALTPMLPHFWSTPSRHVICLVIDRRAQKRQFGVCIIFRRRRSQRQRPATNSTGRQVLFGLPVAQST